MGGLKLVPCLTQVGLGFADTVKQALLSDLVLFHLLSFLFKLFSVYG